MKSIIKSITEDAYSEADKYKSLFDIPKNKTSSSSAPSTQEEIPKKSTYIKPDAETVPGLTLKTPEKKYIKPDAETVPGLTLKTPETPAISLSKKMADEKSTMPKQTETPAPTQSQKLNSDNTPPTRISNTLDTIKDLGGKAVDKIIDNPGTSLGVAGAAAGAGLGYLAYKKFKQKQAEKKTAIA
jgi:hypothetical protein